MLFPVLLSTNAKLITPFSAADSIFGLLKFRMISLSPTTEGGRLWPCPPSICPYESLRILQSIVNNIKLKNAIDKKNPTITI